MKRILGMLCVLLLAGGPAAAQAMSRSERAAAVANTCVYNVKHLAQSAMMFMQDHDEKFALKAADYRKRLMPYVQDKRLFHCPADRSGAVSYTFNRHLAGVPYDKIGRPGLTVMIYEGAGERLRFRHDGTATVGFADSSVRRITREQAKTLRWKP